MPVLSASRSLVAASAGVAVATRFGHLVDTVASISLILFGGWIAVSSLLELRSPGGHGHSHGHDHAHGGNSVHGPERQDIDTEHGLLTLSIFESGAILLHLRRTFPTCKRIIFGS